MYRPRLAGLALALLVCLGPQALPAQDLNPLSAADQARVEQLLQGFDPNSYQLNTQVRTADGGVQPRSVGQAKGLSSLQQVETQRYRTGAPAQTNTVINVFSQARTNTTINIFREAAQTNTTINIFADAEQQQRATEINSILQRYVSAPGPTATMATVPAAPAPAAAPSRTLPTRTAPAAPVAAPQLAPLSASDQARVEKLLQSFDPNSYELRTQVVSTDGSVQPRTVGRDKGLASLQQVGTERMAAGGPAAVDGGPSTLTGPARTNTNINIFSQARTNTTINIFREAAQTNTNVNIFADAQQQRNAMEIDAILQRYLTAP